MSEHTVEVIGTFGKRANRGIAGSSDSTIGGIIVKPPISIGEGFKEAVLGKPDPTYDIVLGVEVRFVASTPDASIFIAESSRKDVEHQRTDIEEVAARIGRLANAPETVMELLSERPF